MRVKDVPTQTVDLLIEDYRAGVTSGEISRRYGVCKPNVLALLRTHGVPIRPRGGVGGRGCGTGGRVASPETVRALIADYREGTGSTTLSHRYQMCADTVLRILRGNGVEIRPKHGPEAHKPPPVGATFGGSTVVGPADIPFTRDVNGQRVYRVRVECWSCKTRRDVSVQSLRRGASRLCLNCSRQANRSGTCYGE